MRANLVELLGRWQSLLRLRDWIIEIDYVPNLSAPNGQPCYGLCTPFVDGKRARILIRDPQTPVTSSDPDVEETLIHELLHLHFAPLAQNSGPGIAAEEQAVWAITEATAKVKDSDARTRLARAVANVATERTAERKRGMDPIILAALKAALSAEDPKAAIEALIAQLEGGGGGGDQPSGDPPAEGMQQGAPDDDDDQQDRQRSQEPPPRAANAAPRQQPRVAAPPAAPARRVVSAASIVTRKEFDHFRIERLLDHRPDLTDVQRRFALSLSYESAENFLRATPAPNAGGDNASSPPGAAPTQQRAALPTAPTQGARSRSAPVDSVMDEIDRRMGLPRAPETNVVRDERTGRLTISSLQPVRIAKKGAA